MNNKNMARIALKLFAIVIAIFGIYHFMDPDNLAIQVPSFLPGGSIWVYVVGAALILAAIAFFINQQIRLAGYLLSLMLIIFALAIHLRGYFELGDKEMQSVSFMNMLKDLGLAFCVLYIASTADREIAE
ncbi:MAG: hypothetical protein ACR2FN_14370 [Chitinophagaceae bacterium]